MAMRRHTRHRPTTDSDGRPVAAPPVTIASAALINRKQVTGSVQKRDWQQEAWHFFDTIGEAHFAGQWRANAASRAHLMIGRIDPDSGGDPTPADDPPQLARQLLDELHGGQVGQADMLRRIALHLTVPGETYLVGIDQGRGNNRRWLVASGDEFSGMGANRPRVTMPDTGETVELDPAQSTIIRMWNPHGRIAWQPDSAMRSAAGPLREIDSLSKHINATVESRLSGAGILTIPQSATMPHPRQSDTDGTQPLHSDPFVDGLTRAIVTAIEDQGDAAARVPVVIKVPDEAIDGVKHLTFSTHLDDNVAKLRQDAIRRFAGAMDMPGEVILGMSGAGGSGESVNHWCTTPDTEILTADGWTTYDKLNVGDQVLTLNHDTGLSEWQPVQAVNTWHVDQEPMAEIRGQRHHSMTTLNHQWPTVYGHSQGNRKRQWNTTRSLVDTARAVGSSSGQTYTFIQQATPHGDLPTEPKYSDALVELVAWFFTEGTASERWGRNTPKVRIYQSETVNPDHVASIRRALTAVFGPASHQLDKGGRYASPDVIQRHQRIHELRANGRSAPDIAREVGVSVATVCKRLKQEPKTGDDTPRWREVHRNNGMVAFTLNSTAGRVILEHAPNRMVNLDFVRALTQAQLELFIATAVNGDGMYQDSGSEEFMQADPQRLDAIELAAILSGRSVRRYEHHGTGRSANGPREKTMHYLAMTKNSYSQQFSPRRQHVTETTYTGVVWCPTTPNGTWLARHNGTVFYTGNSSWQISEEAIKMHIEPLLACICDALTQQFLRPALHAAGIRNPDQWVVWYEASPLKQRPDRSAEAQALFDKGALSLEALVRENGFSPEEDVPEPQERAAVLARSLLLAKPDLVTTELAQLAGLPSVDQPGGGQATTVQSERADQPSDDDAGQQQRGELQQAQTDSGVQTNRNEPPGGTGANRTASASTGDVELIASCHAATLHALELAGKRLFSRGGRDGRGAYDVRGSSYAIECEGQVQAWELHTVAAAADGDHADKVLVGAADHLRATLPTSVDADHTAKALYGYWRHLITTGTQHTRRAMVNVLANAGCLRPAVRG